MFIKGTEILLDTQEEVNTHAASCPSSRFCFSRLCWLSFCPLFHVSLSVCSAIVHFCLPSFKEPVCLSHFTVLIGPFIPVSFYKRQKGPFIAIHAKPLRLLAACSVSCHFEAGPLYRTPGRAASACHSTSATNPRVQLHGVFSHAAAPLQRFLHWLPVAACIGFKTLACRVKYGPAPTYLKALIIASSAALLIMKHYSVWPGISQGTGVKILLSCGSSVGD